MKRLSLISLVIILFGIELSAQKTQVIKVEGIARIYEVPEEIVVSIDISVKDSTYQVCFNNSMEALETLKSHFKKNGIKTQSIKSKNLTVNENYDWVKGKRIRKGFVSTINLEVKDKYTEQYSVKLLNSLNQEGLDINYRINFTFSEEQKTMLRKKALELAIKDATEKVNTIASAANLKLSGIQNINYGTNQTFYPTPVTMMEDDAEMPPRKASNYSGINLNPKEQLIQKSIYIEWGFTE